MRQLRIKVLNHIFITVMICYIMCMTALAAEYKTAPTLNKGVKWRIGYYEGGEYMTYQKTLTVVIAGLMDTGWIEKAEIPAQEGIQTKNLWNWLATQAKSSYLEFVADAHYSINWDKAVRDKTVPEIISRLNEKKDIDLMFAMGTWAGQDLANNKHHTPTLVMSCSDPIASNIVKSVEDSGYDHIHAWTDPFRHERQIWAFHDIIKFKKLGVAYQDTVAGRSYAAINKIEKIAAKQGFEIIRCYTADARPDITQFEDSVRKCFRELVKTADA
ncbi:MAG: ABC transporter substrate-binding protein, partial [Desulfobacteraceae bacterium IS3]